MPDPSPSHHLFVVRLWWEPDQESAGEWRGSVEHVASFEKRYFREMRALDEFIQSKLNQRVIAEQSPQSFDRQRNTPWTPKSSATE